MSPTLSSLRRGDLLRVRDGIKVPLGLISQEGGLYRVVEDDAEIELSSGSLVVFIGLPDAQDDSLVVLAEGRIGWVFVDEVDICT